MRLHRLIAVLLLLESRGRLKARELAAALETSDREAFDLADQAATAALPYHHLYVAIEDTAAPREQISFRNFLRAHPEWVERLSQHKVQLCQLYDNDRQSYIVGKSAMVREITALALESADRY